MERSAEKRSVQTTLHQAGFAPDDDEDYGHLVAHLAEEEVEDKTTFEWTRVFARGDTGDQRAGVYPQGPDLIYDESFLDILSR